MDVVAGVKKHSDCNSQAHSDQISSPKKTHPDKTAPSAENASLDGSVSNHVLPLFMDGLPDDFASNSGLAAIASLLDDEGHKEERVDFSKDDGSCRSLTHFSSGGGKLKKKLSKQKKHSPYNKRKKGTEKISLGEAQLFLNMWKI